MGGAGDGAGAVSSFAIGELLGILRHLAAIGTNSTCSSYIHCSCSLIKKIGTGSDRVVEEENGMLV